MKIPTVLALFSVLQIFAVTANSQPYDPDIYDPPEESFEQYEDNEQNSNDTDSFASDPDTAFDTLLTQDEEDDDEEENGEEEEPAPEKRVYRTVGFGPAGFLNLESENLAYSLYYGSVLVVNPFVNGRFVVEFTTDFSDAFMTALELSVDIFTSEGLFAPYFGAGVSGGFARGAEENVFGFGISGNAGIYLFKGTAFQVNLQGRLNVLLTQIETDYPMYYALRVGILF